MNANEDDVFCKGCGANRAAAGADAADVAPNDEACLATLCGKRVFVGVGKR